MKVTMRDLDGIIERTWAEARQRGTWEGLMTIWRVVKWSKGLGTQKKYQLLADLDFLQELVIYQREVLA